MSTPPPEYQIHSVQFGEDGCAIAYMQVPTDIRVQGRVIASHQVQLHASHPDYRADIRELADLAQKVLTNALEDFNASDPFIPGLGDDEDDDERGMGE